MRRLFLIGFLLLVAALLAGAQESQRTPPGGDMVGSDRTLQRGDVRTSPSPSPDQNQVMTNSSGSSTGYEKVPAYSGTSVEESRARQATSGPSGLQGQTSATAGRRRAHSGSGTGAPPAKSAKRHSKRRTQQNSQRRSGNSAPPQ